MIKTSKNKNVWVNVHFDLMVLNCWVWLSFGIPQMSFQLLVSPYQTKLHFSYLAPKCTLHLCKIWCNFLKNVYNWPITGLMFDIALFSDLNKPNFAINKWILCYQVTRGSQDFGFDQWENRIGGNQPIPVFETCKALVPEPWLPQ